MGFEPIDLCNAGAMLYQLAMIATQLGSGQFVGLVCAGNVKVMYICLSISSTESFHRNTRAQYNGPFSNSHGWTGSSMEWRLMRANLFKCKLICSH